MAYVEKESIREQARQIISEHKIVAPPVPVERIAKQMEIAVRYAPLDDDLSGMAFIKGTHRVIAVNALHHPNRQRFTIAHEIAHQVLHAERLQEGVHVDKVIMRRDELAASGTDDHEIQANVFASELLMPREFLRPVVGSIFDLNDDARLQALARRFKVSTAALQYRLASID